MRSFAKSIAIVAAFCLACPAAGAEPAKEGGAFAGASVFADSFGLNVAERNLLAKQAGSASQVGPRPLPAADSFGLNNLFFPSTGDCPTAKAESKPTPGLRRCIEI